VTLRGKAKMNLIYGAASGLARADRDFGDPGVCVIR
jgi:hypothetical protein